MKFVEPSITKQTQTPANDNGRLHILPSSAIPSHAPVIGTDHLCIASYIRRTPNLHVKMTFPLVQNSVDELGRSFWTPPLFLTQEWLTS